MQYFCRLVDTFGSFTSPAHADGDSRVQIICAQKQIIAALFV
jgi:hypothetical protein